MLDHDVVLVIASNHPKNYTKTTNILIFVKVLTDALGQFVFISFQTFFVNNQPRPGKKSLRWRRALKLKENKNFNIHLLFSSNLVLEQSFDQYHYHSMLIYTIDFYHGQVMDKVLENNQENLVIIPSHLICYKKRHRFKYILFKKQTFSYNNSFIIKCIKNMIDWIIIMTCYFIISSHMTKFWSNMNRTKIG